MGGVTQRTATGSLLRLRVAAGLGVDDLHELSPRLRRLVTVATLVGAPVGEALDAGLAAEEDHRRAQRAVTVASSQTRMVAAGLLVAPLLLVPGLGRLLGADLLGVLLRFQDLHELVEGEVFEALAAEITGDGQSVVRRSVRFALEQVVAVADPDSQLAIDARSLLGDATEQFDDWTRNASLAISLHVTLTEALRRLDVNAPAAHAGSGIAVTLPACTPSADQVAPTRHVDPAQPESPASLGAPIGSGVIEHLELYPWQRRALRMWCEAGRRGVSCGLSWHRGRNSDLAWRVKRTWRDPRRGPRRRARAVP
jgi:hypothetical protein